MDIRPLSYALGAEVCGIDLRDPLSDAQWSQIHSAWLKHIVLVFPGQRLLPEQQIAFGRRFGSLDDHREDKAYTLPEYPQIYLIGNFKVADGRRSKTANVGRGWHTDHSYTTRPTKLSMLYCRAIPPVGGTTMFSNSYMAYDTLSEKLRSVVDEMEAVHDFGTYFAKQKLFGGFKRDPEKIRAKYPSVVHPLVRIHSETNRKALYINGSMMTNVYGMSEEESEGLLRYLCSHATRPEFTFRHSYKVDDLLFWDNRCSQHNALADYVHDTDNPRCMHRLTVLGERHGRFLEDPTITEKA